MAAVRCDADRRYVEFVTRVLMEDFTGFQVPTSHFGRRLFYRLCGQEVSVRATRRITAVGADRQAFDTLNVFLVLFASFRALAGLQIDQV